jgi:hypothetical protein
MGTAKLSNRIPPVNQGSSLSTEFGWEMLDNPSTRKYDFEASLSVINHGTIQWVPNLE